MADPVSDDSYFTPPATGSPVTSDKENIDSQQIPGLGCCSSTERARLVEITDVPVENMDPIPIPEPVPELDMASLNRLIAVRGQRAVRSGGPPKSSFHPYPLVARIASRAASNRLANLDVALGRLSSVGGWGSHHE